MADKQLSKRERAAQVAILKTLKTEIRAMDFVKLADDGHTMLISKVDVLDWIDDLTKNALNPVMFEQVG